MIIEDDQAVRDTISRALQRVGHKTLAAEDGRAGMAQVIREQVDVVITDLVMPNQDGIEKPRK